MKHFTQKQLKQFAALGMAEDITNGTEEHLKLTTLGLSRGVYGLNGALLEDRAGKKYVITSRNSVLFEYV